MLRRGSQTLRRLSVMQQRTKVTWTKAPPDIPDLQHVGDHGSTADSVASMQKDGIKPELTGANFGGASQGGPGLYLTTSPSSAKFFASNASQTTGTPAQTVSIYRRGSSSQKAEMPKDAFYKAEEQRKVHAENPNIHEFDLGPTKVPEEILRKKSSGNTTLLTKQAIEDPRVEYFAVPNEPLSRKESDATMAQLTSQNARTFAAWRNPGVPDKS
jgi:hypothetical protein